MGTSSDWDGYRAPFRRNIDDRNEFKGHVASFIKNTSLRFLQIVYSQRAPGNLHYDDDVERSEIKIADRFAFQLEASDTRPGIIAVRGGMNWSNIGINQGLQELDLRQQKSAYTDLISGSVGFSCISRVGLEAESIASDVFNLFKFFKRTLARNGFFNIRSMSIGPEQLIEAAGEPKLFLVNVLMQCQVQDRWVIEPKSASELRKVVVEGLTEVNGEDQKMFENEMDIRNDDC